MAKPNVVVVGYGFAGRCFHTYLVGLTDSLNLYGVVTSRQEARDDIQTRLGVKVFAHFEEVLEDPQVDLLVLATPNDVHASQAIQAMAAGKHVVTDKPMSLDVAQADAMLQASHQYDRLLSVFQNRRWDGDYLTVKQQLEAGMLGHAFYFELFWGQYGQPRGWRSEAAHGGGKLVDLGAHMIDQALQLIEAPVERVYCQFFNQGWETDVEDHAHCTLFFANGVQFHIGTSSLARHPKPRWYVLGTAGSLVKQGVDPQEQAMIAGHIDAAAEVPENYPRLWREIDGQTCETVVDPVPGRWRSYYENIAAALEDRSVLAVKPESVRAVMVVLAAAVESATSGQAVTLEGISGR